MEERYQITVLQNNKQVTAECMDGEKLLEAMLRQGIRHRCDCGGRGTCGKCKVQVIAGELKESTADMRILSEAERSDGFRLACKACPKGNITITLPAYEEEDMAVLTAGRETTAPSGKGMGTGGYYIGIDLGTTTLAAHLTEGSSGEILAASSLVNPQRIYGADVISRMKASSEGKADDLKKLIRAGLRTLILRVLQGVPPGGNRIEQIAIAGNTTMIHLLMGYSCEGLGVYPFIPVTVGPITSSFHELFAEEDQQEPDGSGNDEWERNLLEELDLVPVSILPGISVFVGGDVVAGLGVCDFDRMEEVCLLIDLGTNGELAIGNKEKLYVSSTAAGPAFEGGNISIGLGSIPGAISRVRLGGTKPEIWTIGGGKPVGICGTGVVELCSELLRTGGMDETGLLSEEYFQEGFPLYEDSQVKLNFTQKDVRELQLAKAAIRAGTELLLRNYGISWEQVEKVYLAGGFGFVLDIPKAVHIGLLPEELRDKIITVGNSSLAGAVRYAADPEFCGRLAGIIEHAQEVHLSNEEDFQELYIGNINFD
jgi:uncharacterized 2Fe-2S/4Fe-4S cluster protein (DUF4445 family)